MRAAWRLVAALLVGGIALAGCTNPEYNTDGGAGDACLGTDTTAPVEGEACPTGEEGTGSQENETDPNAPGSSATAEPKG